MIFKFFELLRLLKYMNLYEPFLLRCVNLWLILCSVLYLAIGYNSYNLIFSLKSILFFIVFISAIILFILCDELIRGNRRLKLFFTGKDISLKKPISTFEALNCDDDFILVLYKFKLFFYLFSLFVLIYFFSCEINYEIMFEQEERDHKDFVDYLKGREIIKRGK